MSLDTETMTELVRKISAVVQVQVDKQIMTLSEKFKEVQNKLDNREGGAMKKENKEVFDESGEEEGKYDPDFSGVELLKN